MEMMWTTAELIISRCLFGVGRWNFVNQWQRKLYFDFDWKTHTISSPHMAHAVFNYFAVDGCRTHYNNFSFLFPSILLLFFFSFKYCAPAIHLQSELAITNENYNENFQHFRYFDSKPLIFFYLVFFMFLIFRVCLRYLHLNHNAIVKAAFKLRTTETIEMVRQNKKDSQKNNFKLNANIVSVETTIDNEVWRMKFIFRKKKNVDEISAVTTKIPADKCAKANKVNTMVSSTDRQSAESVRFWMKEKQRNCWKLKEK